MKLRFPAVAILFALFCAGSLAAQSTPELLPADKLAKLLPPRVFLDGENVPTQERNASGIYLGEHKLAIVSLIDTAGYSSAYQEKYSGVIMTQGSLQIGSQTLHPGQYGLGQKKSGSGDSATVTLEIYDLGGNHLGEVSTERDAEVKPRPEQIVIEKDGTARLYLGRYYTTIAAGK